MLVTAIRADGTVQLGEDARRLGFVPGRLVEVIRTSGGSLILALHDGSATTVEGTATRLPAPKARRAIGSRRG